MAALARQKHGSESADGVAEVRRRLNLLSEGERQVLEGVVAGKAAKVIARNLGLSEQTVGTYRAIVMKKVQADSLSALIRMVHSEAAAAAPRRRDDRD